MAAPKKGAKTVELWLIASDWDSMRIEKMWRLEFRKQFRKVWQQTTVSLFLKTLKTAAFCRKVSQISNFIIFQRKKYTFNEVKINSEEQLV